MGKLVYFYLIVALVAVIEFSYDLMVNQAFDWRSLLVTMAMLGCAVAAKKMKAAV